MHIIYAGKTEYKNQKFILIIPWVTSVLISNSFSRTQLLLYTVHANNPTGNQCLYIQLVYHKFTNSHSKSMQKSISSKTFKVLVITLLHQERWDRIFRVIPYNSVIIKVIAFHVGVGVGWAAGTKVIGQQVVLGSVKCVSYPTACKTCEWRLPLTGHGGFLPWWSLCRQWSWCRALRKFSVRYTRKLSQTRRCQCQLSSLGKVAWMQLRQTGKGKKLVTQYTNTDNYGQLKKELNQLNDDWMIVWLIIES